MLAMCVVWKRNSLCFICNLTTTHLSKPICGTYGVKQACRYSSSYRHKSKGKSGRAREESSVHGQTYSALVQYRRQQAERSVLIQHNNRLPGVYEHCSQFGQVQTIFPFKSGQDKHETVKTYALIEYDNPRSVENLLDKAGHFPNDRRIAVRSRYLFHPGYERAQRLRRNTEQNVKRLTPEMNLPLTEPELHRELCEANTLSDQISILYSRLKMTELETRMRFFLCTFIQDVLRGLLHRCSVTPFGSSVNGFGRLDGDLDMVMEVEEEQFQVQDKYRRSDMYFLSKQRVDNERGFMQYNLDTLAGVLQLYIPQCTNVRRILKARVPIIKFNHAGSKMECDLCFQNRAGIYMSELLYIFGELDARVRPLVFAVRRWARANEITHSNPGPWVSNFILTLMVVFFLQSGSQQVLPSLGTLQSLAGPTDKKVLEDGQECSFKTNWAQIPPAGSSNTNLENLMKEFYQFYGDFDFKENALSLVVGKDYPKPEDCPMYIENPIERQLNVSKNVQEAQVNEFQIHCKNALKNLEKSSKRTGKLGSPWGLVRICNKDNHDGLTIKMSRLFEEDKPVDQVVETPNFSVPQNR